MSDKIKNTSMPDPLATYTEKKTNDYGLKYAKSIESEWFNGGIIGDDCNFSDRRNYIENKRLLVRGKQDDKKFKDHATRQEGDLDYMNQDWGQMNVTAKFCNVVSNGISDENYRLDIRANDRLSVKMKTDKMEEHKKNMRSLPMLQKTKQLLGLDLIPKGFIPEDDEELKLYMEIKDKPKIEIAEELIIDFIKKTNRWHTIDERKNKDLVEIGIAASRIWTDASDGIKVEYVDPENFGHSFVEQNDFNDSQYFFVVDTLTINEIQRESGFDDAKMRKIAKAYGKINNITADFERGKFLDLINIKCDVMRFAFKSSKTTVYKKHKRNGKTTKIVKKSDDYNPPEDRSDYGKLTDTKDTWFEGNFIVGTEDIYDYKECENLVRDEMNKVRPPFVVRSTNIYKNKLHSFLDDIETIANDLQYTQLKIQTLRAELKPDLTIINLDQLAELESEGKKMDTWKTALNLLNVKGVVFEKTIDGGEIGVQKGQSARPSAVAQGSALTVLLNIWAHDYNLMRDITGVNPARDGSLPADALLGVNQMNQLASNTSTKHIVNASTDFNKMVAEVISSRIHGIYNSKQQGAQKIKELYNKAVGKQNVDAIEVMKDRNLHDFGFTVEMLPTQQEIKEFREDLGIALQEGTIDVETKIEAQQIARVNPKLANQFLIYKRRKKIKERQEEETHRQKLQTESNIASGKSAAQNQSQAYGLKKKMDLQYESQMSQIRLIEKQAMQQIEAPVTDKKFQQEVYIKQLEVASNFNLNKFKEDSKDLRIDKQSTQQSKMIEQRKKENAPPIDFENDIFGNIFNTIN